MADNFTSLAFTDSVKKFQETYGSREAYAKMGAKPFRNELTWQEKTFISHRDSFYVASVGENGWPYMQHRGGPKGFLKSLDDNTLAFADFKGNGQYVSAGNVTATQKALLFLMDYPNQMRLKLWVESQVFHAEDRPDLLESVALPEYKAVIERIFLFTVQAFDWNCPQHISPRYTEDEWKARQTKA